MKKKWYIELDGLPGVVKHEINDILDDSGVRNGYAIGYTVVDGEDCTQYPVLNSYLHNKKVPIGEDVIIHITW